MCVFRSAHDVDYRSKLDIINQRLNQFYLISVIMVILFLLLMSMLSCSCCISLSVSFVSVVASVLLPASLVCECEMRRCCCLHRCECSCRCCLRLLARRGGWIKNEKGGKHVINIGRDFMSVHVLMWRHKPLYTLTLTLTIKKNQILEPETLTLFVNLLFAETDGGRRTYKKD